jgi:hypothetical protein
MIEEHDQRAWKVLWSKEREGEEAKKEVQRCQ